MEDLERSDRREKGVRMMGKGVMGGSVGDLGSLPVDRP